MTRSRFPAPMHSKKACVVYDSATGRIRHCHSVVTFVGGREPTPEQIAADALQAMKALPNPPSGELHVLHVDHDALETGKRYRVDLDRKALAAD